ncbi:putative transporter [Diplonema papillatum]|nr:putative transporter [Diplonema papillatum]|eukprot:gene10132-15576_t
MSSAGFAATLRAVTAVGQLVVMVLAGAYAAHRGLLKRENMKIMSAMCTGVFMPLLLFSNLSEHTTRASLHKAALLPFVAFTLCGAGMLLGFIARKTFLRSVLSSSNSRLFQAACVIGNSSGLPLVITGALVPASAYAECVQYISLYIISVHLVTWFGLYNWLKSHTSEEELPLVQRVPGGMSRGGYLTGSETNGLSRDSLTSLDAPHERKPCLKKTPGLFMETTPIPIARNPSPSWWKAFVESINAPLVGIAFGLFCGLVQPVHANFAVAGAPFKWVHDATTRIGGAAIPCVMTVLGASMYYSVRSASTSKEDRLPWTCITTLVVIRLFLLPLIGVAYVVLFRSVLDDFICIVILVQSCSPTANNVTVICSRLGIDPVPLGFAYMVQYAVVIPVYSYYLAFALNLSAGNELRLVP